MMRPGRSDFDLSWSTAREVTLGAGDEGVLTMEANRRLFRRWLDAGHGEWMVPRDAFDVTELRDLVGSLCVYDHDPARDDFHCRVFGAVVTRDLGVDMTGRYLSDYPAELRQVIRNQYEQALATRLPFVSVHTVTRTDRSDPYPVEDWQSVREKLILPVTRTGRGIDCFITHVARMSASAVGRFPAHSGTGLGGRSA